MMKKKIKQFTRIYRLLSTKIILITFIIIIPVNILLIYVSSVSISILKQQAFKNNMNTLDIYMRQLDKEMNSNSQYISLLSSNMNFIKFCSSNFDSAYILARNNLWAELMNRLYTQDVNEGIFVINKENSDILLAYNTSYASLETMKSNLKSINDLSENNQWHLLELDNDYILIKYNYNRNICYGSFIVLANLLTEINSKIVYNDKILLVTENNSVEINKGQLLCQVKSNNCPLFLSLLLQEREIVRQLPFINRFIYILSLICFALIPILYIILHLILIRPLERINDALRIVENGDIDYRIKPRKTSIEFEHINNSFNSMMDQIMDLKVDNFEKELQKQKIELKSLQLQIKPHFLLNSLNLIYSMAELKDYKSIQQMIQYLAEYFRHGAYTQDTLVTLDEEIKFLHNYLNIAEIRYPNCFEAIFDIQSDILKAKLPSLLLQSFIENIFKHGMNAEKVTLISIEIFGYNDVLNFVISDNGKGIDEMLLNKINNAFDEPYTDDDGIEHTGIFNCKKRLELIYGKNCSLIIKSDYGLGTKVIIRIPYDHIQQ